MTMIDPSPFLAPLEAAIANLAGPAPAALVGVARGGLSAQTAAGVKTVGQDTPAEADAKFHIASQTKMMTAAVVLQLAAEGRFSLDDKLSDVMDVSPLAGIANIETATMHQLLTHSSGIPDYVSDFVGEAGIPSLWMRLLMDPPQKVGVDEAIEFLIAQNAPAEFEPGQKVEYSNTGYLLFQLAIEHVTGQPLAEVFQDRIFDPLGMDDTSFPGIGRPDGIISSYNTMAGQLIDVTHLPIDDAGDGGVVSTTADMIKFMQALVVDKTLVPESQLDGLADIFDPSGTGLGDFVGYNGGALGTTSLTLVHMPTGTIISIALTHANQVSELSSLFEQVKNNVLTNEAWSNSAIGDGPLEFGFSAADLGISEAPGSDGAPQVQLQMEGVSLFLDGPLAEFDTGRLTFSDGSVLFVAEHSADQFSVAQHAAEAMDADNQLIGRGGNNLLIAGHGNDALSGGAGDDWLDGGKGHDVARYDADQSQFTLTIGRDGTVLTDRTGTLGADKLISIEQLDFATGSIDVQALEGLANVPASDLLGIIELYTAYFNRAPDAAGLAFWGAAMANGTTLADAAALFMDQDETRAAYPEGLSNDAFTDAVYQNVLGRMPDAEGKAFWVEVLNDAASGVGRDHFILAVLEGAKAMAQPDASAEFAAQQMIDQAYLEHKTDIGTYFAATRGMSELSDAKAVMQIFDGSLSSLNAARAATDALYESAVATEGGAFLVPIVGILDDPFL